MVKSETNQSKLVAENRRYVEAAARQYLNQGLTLEQLVEEGNKGLVAAAERYDASKGYAFISYAVWWVRQSMLQALCGREPSGGDTLSERERSILHDVNEGRPLADIAAEWNLSEARVRQIYNRSINKNNKNHE